MDRRHRIGPRRLVSDSDRAEKIASVPATKSVRVLANRQETGDARKAHAGAPQNAWARQEIALVIARARARGLATLANVTEQRGEFWKTT